MLDVETGRFVIGEGMEFHPGMTKEDFIKSPMFQNELLHPELDKETDPIFTLRTQTIDGFQMIVTVRFSFNNYVQDIIISKPEYYDWPNWPENKSWEEYADEIGAYNDAFVEKQIEGTVRPGSEKKYSYSWGWVKSTRSFGDEPHIEVTISYDEIAILEAKGYRFDDMSIDELYS